MKASTVIAGMLWSALNLVGTMGAGVLTAVIVARSLGSSDFGRYGYVVWLSATAGQAASLGLARPLARFAASASRDGKVTAVRDLTRRALSISTIAAIALTLVVCVTANALGLTLSTELMLALSAGIVFAAVGGVAIATLQATMRFGDVSRANLAGSLVLLAGSAVLARGKKTWIDQVALAALATSVTGLLLLFSLRRSDGIATATDATADEPFSQEQTRQFSDYWRWAAVLTLIEMVVWQRCELFFLNRYASPVTVGHYNAAFSIASRIVALPLVIGPVLYAVAARMRITDERLLMHAAYRQFTKYVLLVAAPLFILPAGAASRILVTLLGPQYEPAAGPLAILLVGGIIPALSVAGSAVVYGTDNMGFAVKAGVVAAAVTIAADAVLVRRYGAVGAAVGNLMGQGFAVTATLLLLLHPLGFRLPVRMVSAVLGAALAGGFAVHLTVRRVSGSPGLVAALVAGTLVYGALLVWIRPLDDADAEYVHAVRERVPKFARRVFERSVGLLTRASGTLS